MRLIDADALLDHLRKTDRYFDIKFDIEEAPTIDPDSLRSKGRWIERTHDAPAGDIVLLHCSRCDTPHARERNFCNECGADMRERET